MNAQHRDQQPDRVDTSSVDRVDFSDVDAAGGERLDVDVVCSEGEGCSFSSSSRSSRSASADVNSFSCDSIESSGCGWGGFLG